MCQTSDFSLNIRSRPSLGKHLTDLRGLALGWPAGRPLSTQNPITSHSFCLADLLPQLPSRHRGKFGIRELVERLNKILSLNIDRFEVDALLVQFRLGSRFPALSRWLTTILWLHEDTNLGS